MNNNTSPPRPSHTQPSIMAVSKHIPNEILLNVLSRVIPADLLATSLVSHSFHTISQSLLYKQPYLGNKVNANSTHLDSYGEFPMKGPVARFLRTLLLAPRRGTLAAYVRTLIVDLDPVTASAPPSPGIDILTAAALNCGFDEQHLTDQGAQMGLLLHLLPRLTFLELRVGDPPGAVCFRHLQDSLRCPETLPIALRNIHDFKSISTSPLNGITPTMLVALLDLPSIRTITVSMVDDPMETESFVDAMAAAAGTSLVTELNLQYRVTPITLLAGILKIPKALTSFSYSTEGPFWEHGIVSFGQALVPLQHSLQRLNIDFTNMPCFNCYRSPFDPYPTDRYPWIGTPGSGHFAGGRRYTPFSCRWLSCLGSIRNHRALSCRFFAAWVAFAGGV